MELSLSTARRHRLASCELPVLAASLGSTPVKLTRSHWMFALIAASIVLSGMSAEAVTPYNRPSGAKQIQSLQSGRSFRAKNLAPEGLPQRNLLRREEASYQRPQINNNSAR